MRTDNEWRGRETDRQTERWEWATLWHDILLSSAYRPTRQEGTKYDQLSIMHNAMYRSCCSFKTRNFFICKRKMRMRADIQGELNFLQRVLLISVKKFLKNWHSVWVPSRHYIAVQKKKKERSFALCLDNLLSKYVTSLEPKKMCIAFGFCRTNSRYRQNLLCNSDYLRTHTWSGFS